MNDAPALLPERRTLCGPITARRIARTCALYGLAFLVGFAVTQLAASQQWRTFGLGLMVPGGGFLAHADLVSSHGLAHTATAVAAICLFLAALVLWFATGNALAPPAIWLATAVAAATVMTHGEVRAGAPA